MFEINVEVKCDEQTGIHLRPAAVLVDVASVFENTDLFILHNDQARTLKSIMSIFEANLKNENRIKITADGSDEELSARVMKVIMESFDYDPVWEDPYLACKAKVFDTLKSELSSFAKHRQDYYLERIRAVFAGKEEIVSVARLNDKFHFETVPILPYLAKYLKQKIELRFLLKEHIIKVVELFNPDKANSIDSITKRLIFEGSDLDIGSKITIAAPGNDCRAKKDEEQKQAREYACKVLSAVLNNLHQCDEWFRKNQHQDKWKKNLDDFFGRFISECVKPLMRQNDAGLLPNSYCKYTIDNILQEEHVLIFREFKNFDKAGVISLMACPHVAKSGLNYDVIDSIMKTEEEPIVLCEGLAVAHATLKRGPRVLFSLGIFPEGIKWVGHRYVNIVLMFITAKDTHGTYHRYMSHLAELFMADKSLQKDLVKSATPRDAVERIRKACGFRAELFKYDNEKSIS